MTDTVFRTKQDEVINEPTVKAPEKVESTVSSKVEVPYLDYHNEHGKPYIVDHFKLGEYWNDPQGGFEEEVNMIEDYIQQQVKSGEVENSVLGVKSLIKEIEKATRTEKEPRTVVKLGVLASYMRFLTDTVKVKSNFRKYNQI
jgi:hypothetical protein